MNTHLKKPFFHVIYIYLRMKEAPVSLASALPMRAFPHPEGPHKSKPTFA